MRLLLVSALLAPLVTGCGPAMSMATTPSVSRAIALGQLPREGLCQDGLPVRILAGPDLRQRHLRLFVPARPLAR